MKVTALCAAGVLTAAGCGGSGQSDAAAERLSVVTGVYPLEWLTAQVGGDHVEVTNLTEPGAEPHDLELSPRQIGEVSEADVAFHISGLQPAVDEAIESQGGENALDVADLVELSALGADSAAEHDDGEHEGEGHGHGTEDEGEGHGHGTEDNGEDHGHGDEEGEGEGHGHSEGGHDHGELDPHMWLDTERFSEAATGLADRLGEADPDNAADYRANAESVTGQLDELGTEYSDGLAECDSREVVVSHSAFGYLAARFDLEQISPAGLDSHSEPSPARLAEVAETVRDHDIGTVFSEPLTDPGVAETIAEESDAETAVLDPIEGVTDQSPGEDYPSIMRANLDTLSGALGCS